jgi:hypothetical protein
MEDVGAIIDGREGRSSWERLWDMLREVREMKQIRH